MEEYSVHRLAAAVVDYYQRHSAATLEATSTKWRDARRAHFDAHKRSVMRIQLAWLAITAVEIGLDVSQPDGVEALICLLDLNTSYDQRNEKVGEHVIYAVPTEANSTRVLLGEIPRPLAVSKNNPVWKLCMNAAKYIDSMLKEARSV